MDISLDQRLLGDKYQGEEISQVLQTAHHHHIQVIVIPQYHNTTTSQHHNITVPQHYSTTVPQRSNNPGQMML